MSFKNSIWLILFVSLALSCKKGKDKQSSETKSYASTKALIEAEELVRVKDQKNIVVIDFRKIDEYKKGHIGGALNIWRNDIEDTSYPYGGMMAKKEHVEELFSKLGINNNDKLVVYDNKGSSDASRLWWLLNSYGFESIQLLNGGLDAWIRAGGSTSQEMVVAEPSTFTLPPKGTLALWIDKDGVLKTITSNSNTIILDTRSEDEFSGKRKKAGAAKAGRIPKSIHIDWAEAIYYQGKGKFKAYSELEDIYGVMDASKNDTIIAYCHSGVRAAHTTFVLTELLGYENVKNYDGSWKQWSQFDELPFEKDSLTVVNK